MPHQYQVKIEEELCPFWIPERNSMNINFKKKKIVNYFKKYIWRQIRVLSSRSSRTSPVYHRDDHISHNSHGILDQSELDKLLLWTPQNICWPLKK
jgi:hypothetical protein